MIPELWKIVSWKEEMDAWFLQHLALTWREVRKTGKNGEIFDYTFPDTLWLYWFTKIPPKWFQDFDNPVFARDWDFSFKNVLFCALDFDMVFLMAVTVTLLEIMGLNVVQSCLVFYFFFKVFIMWQSKYFG